MNNPDLLPCSQCEKLPNIEHDEHGYMISCENGCYEKNGGGNGDSAFAWFQTFTWSELSDAIAEWNQAVHCNNGVLPSFRYPRRQNRNS